MSVVDIPGYRIHQLIFEDEYIRVYHGEAAASGQEVLLKMVKASNRTMMENAKLMNEYEIAGSLRIPGIVKPLGLLRQGNGLILASEWVHGLTLRAYARMEKLSHELFVQLAIQLASLLEQLHKEHIVHMNIRPETIVFVPSSKKAYLTGLGHAILVEASGINARTLPLIEGSPPYMAPERTGRMNQPISGSTDLYALGVTLYEVLTGQLPFEANDPLEWAHAHVAKPPRPIAERDGGIPPILAAIVLKLLEKKTSARYQSAYGLRADLEQALAHYEQQGEWPLLALGKQERYSMIDNAALEQAQAAASPMLTAASFTPSHPSGFDYAHMLDLAAVMRASQAFAQESNTASLISRLMCILMELAGADRCCYIGIRADQLVVEHVQCMGVTEGFQSPAVRIADYERISQEIVNYTAVKQGPVLLSDASASAMFAQDPYLSQTGMKSVLCLPVAIQERWQALLYMENSLLAGVFDEERVGVLRTLASQIHVVQQLHAHFGQTESALASGSSGPALLPNPLTERELEVLKGMSEGLTTKEIAKVLIMSPETVKVHTRHIFDKLQVNNRVKAVTTAARLQLLPPV